MAFEFSKGFAQRWQRLQGFERQEVLGELKDLVLLLEPNTKLDTWQRSAAVAAQPSSKISEQTTQSSLFEQAEADLSVLKPAQAESSAHGSAKTPLEETKPAPASQSQAALSMNSAALDQLSALKSGPGANTAPPAGQEAAPAALHAKVESTDFELLDLEEDALDDALSSVLERWWRAHKAELIKALKRELQEDL